MWRCDANPKSIAKWSDPHHLIRGQRMQWNASRRLSRHYVHVIALHIVALTASLRMISGGSSDQSFLLVAYQATSPIFFLTYRGTYMT
jgi:hypothetical protein